MVTLAEFIAELLFSAVELVRIFAAVALRDPLSLVTWLVGAVLTTVSVLLLAWLALGALGQELGLVSRTPSGPPRQRGG